MADAPKPDCVLFGANGQLGFALQRGLAKDFAVHAFDRQACDLTDASAIAAVIARHRPQVIVNAAAYTAVDKAESEPDAAYAVNARAVQVIGQQARRIDAAVLHFSTDYVFGGEHPSRPNGDSPFLERGMPEGQGDSLLTIPPNLPSKEGRSQSRQGDSYTETDTPAPLNAYGASKLAGERLLQDAMADGRYWIIRTSWVFGLHGGNFLKTMLRLAQERDQLSVVDDQIGAPTSAALIAETSARLLRVQPASGIYHLAAAGETSWYGYARHAIAHARARGLPIRLAADALKPIPTSDYPTPAARPRNSRLDCTKIEQALSIALPDWRQGVEQAIDALAGADNP